MTMMTAKAPQAVFIVVYTWQPRLSKDYEHFLPVVHFKNTFLCLHRVMVLKKGHVDELGTVENLLANKDSAFYSFAKDAGLV